MIGRAPQDASPHVAESCDVICSAVVTPDRDNVRRHLLALAKASLGLRGSFSPVYHLVTGNPDALPAGLAMYDKGPIVAAGYLAAVADARIVVDLDDGTDPKTRTERLSAAAHSGANLLAEDSPVARACVPPAALFTTPEELVKKVYALLA